MKNKFKIDVGNVDPKNIDALFEELKTSDDQYATCEKFNAKLIRLTNNLIAIGYTGDMTCYLNISKEEAIERYLKDNPVTTYEDIVIENMIKEFEFTDEFLSYSVYPKK